MGSAGFGSATDPDGLRVSYHFDEPDGASVVESVNGGYGTIYFAQRIDGLLGKALRFDAPAAYLQLPSVGSFETGKISIELWVRPQSIDSSGVAQLVGDGAGGVESFRLQLHGARVALLISGMGEAAVPIVTSSSTLQIGRWQLVSATYDGSTARVFIDGTEDAAASVTVPIATSWNGLYVAALPNFVAEGYTDRFTGDLDELKIWSVALSAEQIRAHAAPPP